METKHKERNCKKFSVITQMHIKTTNAKDKVPSTFKEEEPTAPCLPLEFASNCWISEARLLCIARPRLVTDARGPRWHSFSDHFRRVEP